MSVHRRIGGFLTSEDLQHVNRVVRVFGEILSEEFPIGEHLEGETCRCDENVALAYTVVEMLMHGLKRYVGEGGVTIIPFEAPSDTRGLK